MNYGKELELFDVEGYGGSGPSSRRNKKKKNHSSSNSHKKREEKKSNVSMAEFRKLDDKKTEKNSSIISSSNKKSKSIFDDKKIKPKFIAESESTHYSNNNKPDGSMAEFRRINDKKPEKKNTENLVKKTIKTLYKEQNDVLESIAPVYINENKIKINGGAFSTEYNWKKKELDTSVGITGKVVGKIGKEASELSKSIGGKALSEMVKPLKSEVNLSKNVKISATPLELNLKITNPLGGLNNIKNNIKNSSNELNSIFHKNNPNVPKEYNPF